MIRINLLGRATTQRRSARQCRWKPRCRWCFSWRRCVVALGVLYYNWHSMNQEIAEVRRTSRSRAGEKARLETAEDAGGRVRAPEEASCSSASTSSSSCSETAPAGRSCWTRWRTRSTRTDTLWLTSLDRKGNGLTIVGTAGSINAVANFITQLKHSGYFDQVEIKESDAGHQELRTCRCLAFTLTAQFALPQAQVGGLQTRRRRPLRLRRRKG